MAGGRSGTVCRAAETGLFGRREHAVCVRCWTGCPPQLTPEQIHERKEGDHHRYKLPGKEPSRSGLTGRLGWRSRGGGEEMTERWGCGGRSCSSCNSGKGVECFPA